MKKHGGHHVRGMHQEHIPGVHNPLDPFAPTVKSAGSEHVKGEAPSKQGRGGEGKNKAMADEDGD